MSHWETIQDRSSQVSPARLVYTRNYPSEHDDGIYEAVSKSYIPTTHHDGAEKVAESRKSKKLFVTYVMPDEEKSTSILLRLALGLLLLSFPIFLLWQCYSLVQDICSRVDTTLLAHKIQHIQRVFESQVTRSISHAQVCAEIIRQSFHDSSHIIQERYKEFISPIMTSNVILIQQHFRLLRRECHAYVSDKVDWAAAEAITKKTADWIQKYIYPNTLSARVQSLAQAND
ncbi:uncharacterized protein EV154DRAFT_604724 [Mucor mucedo]|uniref:uncharacterized protein n=1 Tax=Mucor mucedo TaxID=29922 RepID=UPI0022208AD3|nr:uncharacterized protein EV154DRAFT_604724 [Mucor mucedo]KAI7888527.1 hypothetical protein EV154DRAFT_604724 [Mucor mucedo]